MALGFEWKGQKRERSNHLCVVDWAVDEVSRQEWCIHPMSQNVLGQVQPEGVHRNQICSVFYLSLREVMTFDVLFSCFSVLILLHKSTSLLLILLSCWTKSWLTWITWCSKLWLRTCRHWCSTPSIWKLALLLILPCVLLLLNLLLELLLHLILDLRWRRRIWCLLRHRLTKLLQVIGKTKISLLYWLIHNIWRNSLRKSLLLLLHHRSKISTCYLPKFFF